jgi:long-chain acyl-CoA synthetase
MTEMPERTVPAGRGVPLLKKEPQTLAEMFLWALAEHNEPKALNYKRDGRWQAISAARMVERSEHIALGLYSYGLRKGDRAAILASNSPEWTLSDAGCQFAGVVDVPIYTTSANHAVKYIIEDSGSRVLFVEDQAMYLRFGESIAECEELERIVFFDSKGTTDERAISLDHLEDAGEELKRNEPDLAVNLRGDVRPDDIATLIYTSGTTGVPKGVMLSHTNLISNVIDASEKYAFSGHDISLSVLPLSHVFERTGMYVYIMSGMAVHFAESIEKVPENLKEVKPTIFIGVPRIFEKVYEKARLSAARSSPIRERIFDWAIDVAMEYALTIAKGQPVFVSLMAKHSVADKIVYSKLREFFGGNLRFCITGGAALSDNIYLIFTGAGIPIMQGYGLTETSPVISSNNPVDARLGTVGKPIRNTLVRIADDGEIEVSGPGVMLGYYHNEEETREVFTGDGWFKTGDIGNLDDDGYITITDRKKELFKTSGGKYIAPTHIEQMIKSSKFVNQVVLVGNERKFPAALIVPNFEMLESYAHVKQLDLKTPAEFCASERIRDLFERQLRLVTENLAGYEKVKNFALMENEFTVDGGELTPTMKMKRRVIDEKYQDIIDRIYAS